MKRLSIALLGILALSCATAQQNAGSRGPGRLAPPPAITCDRNHLTSWTGEVSGYRRSETDTWLQVRTEYGTVEQTTIEHRGQSDAAVHYLLWGESFTRKDGPLIEQSADVLIPGMRATVWVCEDGVTPPVGDWQPPPE